MLPEPKKTLVLWINAMDLLYSRNELHLVVIHEDLMQGWKLGGPKTPPLPRIPFQPLGNLWLQ